MSCQPIDRAPLCAVRLSTFYPTHALSLRCVFWEGERGLPLFARSFADFAFFLFAAFWAFILGAILLFWLILAAVAYYLCGIALLAGSSRVHELQASL